MCVYIYEDAGMHIPYTLHIPYAYTAFLCEHWPCYRDTRIEERKGNSVIEKRSSGVTDECGEMLT